MEIAIKFYFVKCHPRLFGSGNSLSFQIPPTTPEHTTTHAQDFIHHLQQFQVSVIFKRACQFLLWTDEWSSAGVSSEHGNTQKKELNVISNGKRKRWKTAERQCVDYRKWKNQTQETEFTKNKWMAAPHPATLYSEKKTGFLGDEALFTFQKSTFPS